MLTLHVLKIKDKYIRITKNLFHHKKRWIAAVARRKYLTTFFSFFISIVLYFVESQIEKLFVFFFQVYYNYESSSAHKIGASRIEHVSLSAVTCMTELSLIVTLNNQFTSPHSAAEPPFGVPLSGPPRTRKVWPTGPALGKPPPGLPIWRGAVLPNSGTTATCRP